LPCRANKEELAEKSIGSLKSVSEMDRRIKVKTYLEIRQQNKSKQYVKIRGYVTK